MPRYHFHLRDGQYTPDTEGSELPDTRSAQREAVKLAGAMLQEHADKFWTGEDWRLEVTDGAGLVLFTLQFLAVVWPTAAADHHPASRPHLSLASP